MGVETYRLSPKWGIRGQGTDFVISGLEPAQVFVLEGQVAVGNLASQEQPRVLSPGQGLVLREDGSSESLPLPAQRWWEDASSSFFFLL